MSKFVRLGLVAACLALLAASPVAAGAPSVERHQVNVVGELQAELSELCGFDVWADVTGHYSFRVFTDRDGNDIREIDNYNLLVTYYSDNGSVFATNVGPDRLWFNEDGSITLLTTGNIESLHGPGNGGAYQDVGFTEFIINGDDFTVVRAPGQHDDGHDDVLCELLG